MIDALNTSIQGLQKSSLNVAKAADNIANPQRGTEIVEDFVDIKVNQQNFEANALVLKTTKELQETLFNSIDINV
jgi:flagellar basal body rod protein FlgC